MKRKIWFSISVFVLIAILFSACRSGRGCGKKYKWSFVKPIPVNELKAA